MRHFSKRLHSYINHLLNAPSRPGRALLTCNFLSSSISAAIKNHARPSRRISDWSLLTPKARGIAARSKIPSLLPHAFAHLLRGQDRKLSVEASHPSEPIYTIFHKREASARDRSDFTSPHCSILSEQALRCHSTPSEPISTISHKWEGSARDRSDFHIFPNELSSFIHFPLIGYD
jgi:hypothetical protein